MAIDNAASFKAMLNDEINEDLKYKAQEVVAQYIAEAAHRGINMSVDDAYSLSAFRLHVLTGDAVTDNWMDEAGRNAENLPEGRRRARRDGSRRGRQERPPRRGSQGFGRRVGEAQPF